jgi:hypothetical protein
MHLIAKGSIGNRGVFEVYKRFPRHTVRVEQFFEGHHSTTPAQEQFSPNGNVVENGRHRFPRFLQAKLTVRRRFAGAVSSEPSATPRTIAHKQRALSIRVSSFTVNHVPLTPQI